MPKYKTLWNTPHTALFSLGADNNNNNNNVVTLTERLLLGPAQVVSGEQEAEGETPAGRPPDPAVAAPEALKGPDVQTDVPHHSYRQNTASCRHTQLTDTLTLWSLSESWRETYRRCIFPWRWLQGQTASQQNTLLLHPTSRYQHGSPAVNMSLWTGGSQCWEGYF